MRGQQKHRRNVFTAEGGACAVGEAALSLCFRGPGRAPGGPAQRPHFSEREKNSLLRLATTRSSLPAWPWDSLFLTAVISPAGPAGETPRCGCCALPRPASRAGLELTQTCHQTRLGHFPDLGAAASGRSAHHALIARGLHRQRLNSESLCTDIPPSAEWHQGSRLLNLVKY